MDNRFELMLRARGFETAPATDVRVIGIDLGTTNSSVSEAAWRAGRPSPEPVLTFDIDQQTPMGRHTSPLVPSVVYVQDSGSLVGEGAKVQRGRMSDHALGLRRGRDIFWDCKNHMGLTKTYHLAPAGYRSAREVESHILTFLLNAAREEDDAPVDRVIVTVPASFRVPQRQDTREAAELAGIHIEAGDLVDEPVAAFLDYILSHDITRLELTAGYKNVLVFDFGGGTCDVAIFRVSVDEITGQVAMAPLTVSRYHRLGGGDIDAAIVYEVLIPQLMEQNGLAPFDLSYEDKSVCIAPALLSIAESLKIGLCKEISRLTRLGKYPAGEDRGTVFKRNPGTTECVLKDGRKLSLSSPTLTAVDFDKLLAPFMDRDFLFARETEYRMTCSIFAPLADALNRASLEERDISVGLMAGSSSFIPQVQEELDRFFTNGYVVNFDTPDDAKLAISRGAAFHALALHLTGNGLVQPVSAEAILVQTNHGPEELVPTGAHLPFPETGGWGQVTDLVLPAFPAGQPRDLRLELTTPDQMPLFTGVWPVPDDVPNGAPLRFEYRVDANQVLRLRVNARSATADESWEYQTENPFVNVEYPESKREEIEQLEEKIRTAQLPREEIPDAVVRVADLTADLGQRERALDLLKKALAARHGEDPFVLNKMGILCGELGDYERQAKFYNASAEVGEWGAPLFNLALSQNRRGQVKEARENIEEALARSKSAPFLVLRAVVADTQQDPMIRDECLKEATELFGTVRTMSNWELGWYLTAADLLDDDQKAGEARKEQQRRLKKGASTEANGMLPDRGEA